MTEEQKRDDRIKYRMIRAELERRIRATPSVKAAAACEGISPSDYLWNLYKSVEQDADLEFRRLKTMQLKTEFMRGEFERKYGAISRYLN